MACLPETRGRGREPVDGFIRPPATPGGDMPTDLIMRRVPGRQPHDDVGEVGALLLVFLC